MMMDDARQELVAYRLGQAGDALEQAKLLSANGHRSERKHLMQAQAIRETTHVANGRIILEVPWWMNDQDVEVIVFSPTKNEKAAPGKKRQRNLLAGKGPFKMAEDFDDELPDAFWLGEENG